MVYLNEVNISDGPIHFIESSVDKFENFRLNLKEDYKKTGGNIIQSFEKVIIQVALDLSVQQYFLIRIARIMPEK